MGYRAFLKIVILAFSITTSHTSQSEQADFPSLAENEVQINNSSTTSTVKFQIKGDTCSAMEDVLKPDSSNTYRCGGTSAFLFTMMTIFSDRPNVSISASLKPWHRYEIYSRNDKVWDIREINAR